jgi:hypothetical protein
MSQTIFDEGFARKLLAKLIDLSKKDEVFETKLAGAMANQNKEIYSELTMTAKTVILLLSEEMRLPKFAEDGFEQPRGVEMLISSSQEFLTIFDGPSRMDDVELFNAIEKSILDGTQGLSEGEWRGKQTAKKIWELFKEQRG